LNCSLYFVTLTLNTERGKNRQNQQTIIDATRRAIKLSSPKYYLMIYEQHKDGAWHSHLIAPILDAIKIINNYTAGFTYFETIRSNTYNELAKYMTKQPKGKRSIYCSEKLNLLINKSNGIRRRNQHNESKFNQSDIQER